MSEGMNERLVRVAGHSGGAQFGKVTPYPDTPTSSRPVSSRGSCREKERRLRLSYLGELLTWFGV